MRRGRRTDNPQPGKADLGVGIGKLRVRGGDENVASHGDLEAAGCRHAVDRADDRALEFQQRRYHIERERLRGVGFRLAQFIQVEPGAERAARTRHNEHAHRRVAPELFDCRNQFGA